jgi:hypothetical protein
LAVGHHKFASLQWGEIGSKGHQQPEKWQQSGSAKIISLKILN